MPRVQSDAVRRISWDGETRTLFVQFVSGETYAYLDVPARAYGEFLAAESLGRHFQSEIRGRYPYRRVTDG